MDFSLCKPFLFEKAHSEVFSSAKSNGSTRIFNAQRRKKISLLCIMSTKNASAPNKALLKAATECNLSKIAESLAQGANIETQNKLQRTPLFLCCENGCLECVVALVEAGADINTRDHIPNTPLTVAIQKGNLELIRFLIAQPAIDMNAVTRGYTPLSLLVDLHTIEDKSELVKRFIKRDALLIIGTANALWIAINKYSENPEFKKIVKIMIEKSSVEQVKKAVEHSYGSFNNALYQMIIIEGSTKSSRKQFMITEMLLKRGADINCKIMMRGTEVPLFVSVFLSPHVTPSMIRYFLTHRDFELKPRDIELLAGRGNERIANLLWIYYHNPELLDSVLNMVKYHLMGDPENPTFEDREESTSSDPGSSSGVTSSSGMSSSSGVSSSPKITRKKNVTKGGYKRGKNQTYKVYNQ
jgi:ankyrin repeat protein